MEQVTCPFCTSHVREMSLVVYGKAPVTCSWWSLARAVHLRGLSNRFALKQMKFRPSSVQSKKEQGVQGVGGWSS